jgi:hypothetical protein
MGWVKKAFLIIAATGSSKSASAAGAAGSVLAAGALGLELAPFVVGAFGATVVIGVNPPKTRGLSWATAVVSVFFGGVGGPLVVGSANAVAMHYLKTPDMDSVLADLMAAGLLSAGWPWFGPVLWAAIRSRISALGKKGVDDAHL